VLEIWKFSLIFSFCAIVQLDKFTLKWRNENQKIRKSLNPSCTRDELRINVIYLVWTFGCNLDENEWKLKMDEMWMVDGCRMDVMKMNEIWMKSYHLEAYENIVDYIVLVSSKLLWPTLFVHLANLHNFQISVN